MKTLSPETETISANKRKVNIIKELVQGQEAATQLKLLFQNPFQNEVSLSSEELEANVFRSFTEAISIITSSLEPGFVAVADVAHWNLLNSGENGSPVEGAGHDLTCGDSSESRKRSKKGGRGCYKRRGSVHWRVHPHWAIKYITLGIGTKHPTKNLKTLGRVDRHGP